ncbi:hypothetical protein ACTXL8_14665 [Glutamicibacter arilaitensis]|uniref:hypothetical protein n=1 Tax=Glutamicibacter arilaitensis TaxID=256701 RepID=UPI003FD22A06
MDDFWSWIGTNWIALLAAIGSILAGLYTWKSNSKATAANKLAAEANSISRESLELAKTAKEFVSFDCRPIGDGRKFRIRNTGNVRVSVYSILFENGRPRWKEYPKSTPLDPGQELVERIVPEGPHPSWTVNEEQDITIAFHRGGFLEGPEEQWTGSVQPGLE